MTSRRATVGKLGVVMTIAYASSYYLPAILAVGMARTLGVTTSTVFLAFSAALLVSAVMGPFAGRLVDRHGGRIVLSCASGVFAAGLIALSFAQGPVSLFVAWLLIGVAMGAGFYEVAFAALVRVYGATARSAITGITLIAGFASTVGWPLTAWLDAELGWRAVCLVWAAIHLAVALPLNLMLPSGDHGSVIQAGGLQATRGTETADGPAMAAAIAPDVAAATDAPANRSTAWLLAFVFGATWFVSTAMAAHLPAVLQANGVGLGAAIAFASLVGPAQVAGRLLEYSLLRNVSPLWSARVASVAHAVGAVVFLAVGVPAGIVFTVLHGAGNGIMTIANGTLPLLFFGPVGYGARQGVLMMPARFAQALAPFIFGLALGEMGASALWLSAGLGGAACIALMSLRVRVSQG